MTSFPLNLPLTEDKIREKVSRGIIIISQDLPSDFDEMEHEVPSSVSMSQ